MAGRLPNPETARPRQRTPRSEAGDNLRRRFALNLRLLRHDRRMTQEQLASAARLCRTFLNRLERGRHSVTLETIGSLAEALDVPPETLILAQTAECPRQLHLLK